MTDRRQIVVGDVHGCHLELMHLMKACKFSVRTDDLYFLGDLVDRGPAPAEVVQFVELYAEGCVLGNHDASHLAYWEKGGDAQFRTTEHARTHKLLNKRHFDFLAQLPLTIELPGYLLVHAGIAPGVALGLQDPKILMHAQMLLRDPDSGLYPKLLKSYWPNKAPEGAKFWAELYELECERQVAAGLPTPPVVVYGHTVFEQPAELKWSIGIDLGVPFGRELCALILPDRRFVRVPAVAEHYKGSRAHRIEVMPGHFTYT